MTITGGSVTASSTLGGTGIGGGYKGLSGTVNISGGTINASGGDYATGIGGAYKASSCTVNISGGRIYAKGSLSAGIGSALKGDSSTVNISGGTIETHGDSCTPSSFPGIDADGNGSGTVRITGGNVMAVSGKGYTDSEVKPTPVNASGEKVARTLLSIPLVSSDEQEVTTLAYKLGDASAYAYGTTDVYTLDSGKVYAYLPTHQSALANLYTATANSRELSAQDPVTYTLHPVSVTDSAFQNYIFDLDKATPVASNFTYTVRDYEVAFMGGVPFEHVHDGATWPITVGAARGVSGMGTISNLRYKAEGSSEYTIEPPSNVGAYGVYVDVAVGASYGLAKDLQICKITIQRAKAGDNPVTVTDCSGVYDGQEHALAASAAKSGSTLHYSTDGGNTWSETAPTFKTPNDSCAVSVKATNPNYYDSDAVIATVTISKRPITITASSATVAYNGTEQSIFKGTYVGAISGDWVVDGKDADGNTYDDAHAMPYECKGTDARDEPYQGQLVTDPAGMQNPRDGKMHLAVRTAETKEAAKTSTVDVTDCYDISLVTGSLTITKAPLTLTGASGTKGYTGAEQKLDTFVSSGLVNGQVLSGVTYSAAGTDVGRYPGAFSGTAAVKSGATDVTCNYKIAYKPGALTITDASNYVTADGYTGIYDGRPHSITATPKDLSYTLSYSIDYDPNTGNVGTWGANPEYTNEGTYKVYVKATKTEAADTAITSAIVQIDPKPILADVSIDAQTYTGAALTPAATVKDGTNTLTAGTDYDISNYTDNTNAGTASCTITLRGNYEGATTAHFAIRPAAITVPTAIVCTYDGFEQTGVAAGAGCTVAGGSATSAGTYTATASLSDKSNTAWTDGTTADKQITWSIAKALASENTVKATDYSGTYDGKAHGIAASADKPGSTIYYSIENANWSTATPTWKDVELDAQGTAVSHNVYVKATNPNYEDGAAKSAKVTINKATLKAAYKDETVGYGDTPAYAVGVADFVNGETADTAAGYTAPMVTDGPTIPAKVGSYPLTPADGAATNYDFSYVSGTLTVAAKTVQLSDVMGGSEVMTYTGSPITLGKDDVEIYVGGNKLTYGTDYDISDYKDNTNAGTGFYTLTFKGNYSGAVADYPGLFIMPADASSATVSGAVDKPYTGDPIEQKLTVKLGETTLVEGTDYNVKYNDNVNIGTAGYTVEFTGNYSADSKAGTFKITTIDASKSTILPVDDQAYTGSAIEPSLIVITPDGKNVLEKGADYDVVFSDNVDAGTATAKLTFKGDYKGTASCTFKIAPAAVGVPAVATGLAYTGSEQTGVSAGDLYTVAGGSAADAGSYTATVSLKDKKNTAWTDGTTVDKVVVWSIAPADASAATVSGIDAGYTYTGRPIEPAPTVTLDGKTLVAGTDYTVSYADNTDPGTAAWTVAFIGNYASAKPITGTFAIAKVRKAQMDAPDGVTQKGLDQVLAAASAAQSDAKSIDVELIIIDANPLDADAKAVQSALVTAGLKPGALYNAFLGKVVDGTLTDIGSSNDVLVGVTYPFDFSDKDQVRVFVRHGGQTYELTTAPNAHGEYIALDRSAGTVTVYAKRYSTFGIGYTEAAVSPATPAPASAAPASNQTASSTAATGDAMLPWAAGLAALALATAGSIVLAVRRRRADGPSRGARPRR